jgi:hypothetical protein
MENQIEIILLINDDIYAFLEENFDDTSKYIDYLIRKDLRDCGLLKNNPLEI